MADTQDGRVKIDEGIVFGSGGGRPLRCDVFRPPEPLPDRKAVLLIHGGAWMQGDRSQLRGYGIALGRLGYLCVSAEYRLVGEKRWPAQIHDVKAALRFMRAECRGLDIDPRRICVSGNSAGGHLALLLAGTQNLPELEGEGGHAGAGTECQACMAFYPPVSLRTRTSDPRFPQLFDEGASDEDARGASPLHHAARPGFPPTLLLHGNSDDLVPVAGSLQMYQALRAAGTRAELHVFSDAPHGFDMERGLGRQCVQLMHLFLDRHL
jgi:acetyl esterase/lipase